MLADEPRHPAQVPERVAAEEALVDHGGVRVVDDRFGNEPALPAGLSRRGRRRRCPRRSGESRRPSRRSPPASSGASAGRRRRAASRPARARPGACRSETPGARRDDAGAGAAFGARSCPARPGSGGATAATSRPARRRAGRRGRRAGVHRRSRTSAATAPGSGTASGLDTSTYSPVVAATPAFTFAANVRGRGLSSTRAPAGSAPTLPGRFAITTSSSTWGASAGSDASSSRAWPCETTIAETVTRAPPGRPRASAPQSRAS